MDAGIYLSIYWKSFRLSSTVCRDLRRILFPIHEDRLFILTWKICMGPLSRRLSKVIDDLKTGNRLVHVVCYAPFSGSEITLLRLSHL